MKKYSKEVLDLDEKLKSLKGFTNGLRLPVFSIYLRPVDEATFLYLAEYGNKSMKELSDYMLVQPNIMTGIITRLQKEGMICRYQNKDRRKVMIEVEPKWKQAYEMHLKELERLSQIVVEAIGEEKFDLLIRLLSEATEQLAEKIPAITRTA